MLIFEIILPIIGLMLVVYGRHLLKNGANPSDASFGIISFGIGVIILFVNMIIYLCPHIKFIWIN